MSTGSCNASIFAVQEGAAGFYNSGPAYAPGDNERDASFYIVPFEDKNNTTNNRLMMCPDWRSPGFPWCWYYSGRHSANPEIWTVCDSAGIPVLVWEAEHKEDREADSRQPISLVDRSNRSVIPSSGFATKLLPIDTTILDSIEADVITASLPAWVSGTRWANNPTTTSLLQSLFRNHQTRSSVVRKYSTLAAFKHKQLEEWNLLSLLWLRAASQILYNHSGETIIPLVLDKFTIDSTYGFASLT